MNLKENVNSNFSILRNLFVLCVYIVVVRGTTCPRDLHCICKGSRALEVICNIDGGIIKLNLVPNIYLNVECFNLSKLDDRNLQKVELKVIYKSVSFKNCPLPESSFGHVLKKIGVTKTSALIYQNSRNFTMHLERKHFTDMENLTKLILSTNGNMELSNNVFTAVSKLTWLNLRFLNISLNVDLFKPLKRLKTLEISYLSNVSSNVFAQLTALKKLSISQRNLSWISEDIFDRLELLEELDLSGVVVSEFPNSILKPLAKLKKLTLYSNKFASLPENVFKNNNEIEDILILNNDVKLLELPRRTFGSLRNLKHVIVKRCGLKNIPYDLFIGSPFITNISLAYNDIEKVPQSLYNDQLNLLELDLSHNKIKYLENMVFSSLVRLERLNLDNNQLQKISEATFSSLLSLIYLNLERNKIETIPSHFLSNNKQSLSINFAYNKLNFVKNNSLDSLKVTPLDHFYNLRLLNLSHNLMTAVFDDLWKNGHYEVDIRYNNIQYLCSFNSTSAMNVPHNTRKKYTKQLWIAGNPIKCDDINLRFLGFIHDEVKTKIPDITELHCSNWKQKSYHIKYTILALVSILICLVIVICSIVIVYRKSFFMFFKKNMYRFSKQNNNR